MSREVSMARYAVAFDLDTKSMKADAISNAERTKIYQSEIPNALQNCGFSDHLQRSLYATPAHEDPITAIMQLQMTLQNEAPRFCKYVKRLHVFRLEEWSDVTPLVAGHPAASIPDVEGEDEEQEELAELET
jgi:virulence-associated protein VapD